MTIPGAFNVNADGSAIVARSVPATANYGLVSIGPGPWDGTSAGHYSGSPQGTILALSAASGYSGRMMQLDIGGTALLSIDQSGNTALAGALTSISNTGAYEFMDGFSVNFIQRSDSAILKLTETIGQTQDLATYYNNGQSQILHRVRADGLGDYTFSAAATKQKAGAPVDGDWTVAPPNGTIVVDSTDNKLWARVGGAWKGVTIA